jgi:hypothetical protein
MQRCAPCLVKRRTRVNLIDAFSFHTLADRRAFVDAIRPYDDSSPALTSLKG